nr:hypothetical protein [Tanacetum cinerariifolium]
MSAMANTTPIVTTVTKPATNPRDVDATPKISRKVPKKEEQEKIPTVSLEESNKNVISLKNVINLPVNVSLVIV